MGRIRPTLILGGPGCGKTTRLLEIVEAALDRGVSPDRIAFVAFTRKAAQEARDRMVEKFGVEKDAIPYFRTLHSFAFKHIDVQPSQILDDNKLREYAKAEGLQLSARFIDDFNQAELTPSTVDEMALTAISLARLMQRPLHDVAIEHDLDTAHVDKIDADYREFKYDAVLLDFTDMLERFTTDTVPNFDLLIVDEAQDLSRLQWSMVEKLVEVSKDVYFAGDDDQAIYEWSGADVPYFLSLDADREVLPVSYRLKRNVFDACQKMIRNVDHRYLKDWQPHADGGVVDHVSDLSHLDLEHGEWYLLARTNSLVQTITAMLRQQGFAYIGPTHKGMAPSTDAPQVQAVLAYENMRAGKRLGPDKADLAWKFMRKQFKNDARPVLQPGEEYGREWLEAAGIDTSKTWLECLDVSGAMRDYIRAMRARRESLTKRPRITAATFHGVKGGEADNVAIWQKLTGRTFKRWSAHDPQEVRAMFTAMSRAKERLVFVSTSNRTNYGVERYLL